MYIYIVIYSKYIGDKAILLGHKSTSSMRAIVRYYRSPVDACGCVLFLDKTFVTNNMGFQRTSMWFAEDTGQWASIIRA